MAVRKPNRKSRVAPGLALAQGLVLTGSPERKGAAPVIVDINRRERPVLDDASLLTAYETHLRLHENRSETTTTTYRAHLRAFSRYIASEYPKLSLPEVQAVHVKTFLLAEAARGIEPATRAAALWALRSFYDYLVSEDLIVANPASSVRVPGARKLRTAIYTDDEADPIISWAARQEGVRWQVGHVLLSTFRYTGLRLNELATLRLDQVDLGARRISVVGKGEKERVVPIPPVLVPVQEHYLTSVRPALPHSKFFFINPNSARTRKFHGRYGPRSVADLVLAAGKGAGAAGRHFPHRWRHTYATSLLRRGVDIHVVQRLLGHSNIATTTRYLHLSDTDLADAVDRAFPEG
ncbi:MAG: tyrosine-type recombinase/integrase [Acidimicrobiales bacterium]|jgi:site-specific recombinase XerD